MHQDSLFHEDIFDAVKTDVMAIGGAKKVGAMLWPEKSADKAGEHLSNCLNRLRAEKLDIEQVMFIARQAREVGSHATMTFFASDCGFSVPQPVDPADERAELQRQVVAAAADFKTLVARLERVSLPISKGVR